MERKSFRRLAAEGFAEGVGLALGVIIVLLLMSWMKS